MRIPLDTAIGTIVCGLLLTMVLFLIVRHMVVAA